MIEAEKKSSWPVGRRHQIREVLIYGNYLSQKDIDICRGFDAASLVDQPEFESIRALHEALILEYGLDNDRGAL